MRPIGTLVAHVIGWRLIPLNFNQQRYEADFRFAIARVTDNSEPVALMRGEAGRARRTAAGASAPGAKTGRPGCAPDRLTGFIAGYGHVSTVFPILIVTPAYMAGAIPLGVADAGGSSHSSASRERFAFCLSSYSKIAEWKAIVDRLSQFEAAMAAVDHRELPGAALDVAAPRQRRDCDSRSDPAAAATARRSRRCPRSTLPRASGS